MNESRTEQTNPRPTPSVIAHRLKAGKHRNRRCPCGSGKKLKKCCCPNHEAAVALAKSMETD